MTDTTHEQQNAHDRAEAHRKLDDAITAATAAWQRGATPDEAYRDVQAHLDSLMVAIVLTATSKEADHAE